jgi:hypothetical protein
MDESANGSLDDLQQDAVVRTLRGRDRSSRSIQGKQVFTAHSVVAADENVVADQWSGQDSRCCR